LPYLYLCFFSLFLVLSYIYSIPFLHILLIKKNLFSYILPFPYPLHLFFYFILPFSRISFPLFNSYLPPTGRL
jgi:hypothetical protein